MKTQEETDLLKKFASNNVEVMLIAFEKLKSFKISEAEFNINYLEKEEEFEVKFLNEHFYVNVHMDSVEVAEKELMKELFIHFYNLNDNWLNA